MVFAGHETTALMLTWAFVLFRKRPDIVAQLKEEVDRVLCGRAPTAEDLQKMPYMRRVLDEVLRLRAATSRRSGTWRRARS